MAEKTDIAALQALRSKLGISLLELAAHTGLQEDYLIQIEKGEVVPLESDLKRMGDALRSMAREE